MLHAVAPSRGFPACYIFTYFTLLYFTLLYFTLLYFTLLYFTLLYFTLLYFTLVGVFSSDVSRSSCTTSFTPCCSIFSQSYVFFQGCPCRLLDVIDVLHPGAPSSSFPRHHSENACLYYITLIVSACMSKESHFSFYNLGKEFASSLKFIQHALVCPFLRPTYPQQPSVAPHFSCF